MLSVNNLELFYDGSTILNQVNLNIAEKTSVVITGCSGSGKSSLLHVIAGLQSDYNGSVLWDGADVKHMTLAEKLYWRRTNLGFIFQFHNLLRDFLVVENVMLPLVMQGAKISDARLKACELLEALAISSKINSQVGTLSGGEKQRVAIARAVIHQPKLIIADEPTGSLDPSMAQQAMDLLFKLANNSSIIMVTHNVDLVSRFSQHYQIQKGDLIAR